MDHNHVKKMSRYHMLFTLKLLNFKKRYLSFEDQSILFISSKFTEECKQSLIRLLLDLILEYIVCARFSWLSNLVLSHKDLN